jgi:hypothetical protein
MGEKVAPSAPSEKEIHAPYPSGTQHNIIITNSGEEGIYYSSIREWSSISQLPV